MFGGFGYIWTYLFRLQVESGFGNHHLDGASECVILIAFERDICAIPIWIAHSNMCLAVKIEMKHLNGPFQFLRKIVNGDP